MIRIVGVFTIALLALTGCGSPEESENVPEKLISAEGKWQLVLPPYVQSIPDTTVMQLTITNGQPDTLIDILVKQRTNGEMRTIYTSGGVVYRKADSLTVISENCMMWDTVSSQLIALDGTLCGTPFTLATLGLSESEWLISGKSIGAIPILTESQKKDIEKITLLRFSKIQ